MAGIHGRIRPNPGSDRIRIALAAFFITAPQAGAIVVVDGTGEPAFTRSTTNTQWVQWAGSASYEAYKVEFDNYTNNVFTTTQ